MHTTTELQAQTDFSGLRPFLSMENLFWILASKFTGLPTADDEKLYKDNLYKFQDCS